MMLWKMIAETVEDDRGLQKHPDNGRFVLHRHRDGDGEHLDLRLEQAGHCMGWRIEAVALDTEAWGVEKAPHPLRWLDDDGDAQRVDEGTYAWLERGTDRRAVLLRGENRECIVRCTREQALSAQRLGELTETVKELKLEDQSVAAVLRDGHAARERTIARFCGLGRELDGDTFDEIVWRRALAALSLDEIHAQLAAYETRFDAKYPPQPTSQPERLPEEDERAGAEEAWRILQE